MRCCTAQLKADPDIRREGTEVFSTLQLPYLKAILGGTVRVATLDGDADLRVPPGEPPSDGTHRVWAGRI